MFSAFLYNIHVFILTGEQVKKNTLTRTLVKTIINLEINLEKIQLYDKKSSI